MKKNRIVSFLAAAAILFSIYATAGALAEYGGSGNQQSDAYVYVPEDEELSSLIEQLLNNSTSTAEYGSTPDASASPTPDPIDIFLLSGLTPSAESDFVLDGSALISYQGNASSVFVPEGVTVICTGAFAGNKTITSVTLPDSVVEIQSGAFQNCTNLMFVTTSTRSRLSRIGENAFAGCPLLNTSFALEVNNVSENAFPGHVRETLTPEPTATPKPRATMRPIPENPASLLYPVQSGAPAVPGVLWFSRQPESVQAEDGDRVTFVVVAEGNSNIQYQWLRSRDGYNWATIENGSRVFENASTNALSFVASASTSGYLFKCIVYDGVNIAESNVVYAKLISQGASGGNDPWGYYFFTTPAPSATPAPDASVSNAALSVQARQISDTSARISWTPMKSAYGYELYRYSVTDLGAEEHFDLLGTFADTSYVDENLNFSKYKYTYSVKAVLSPLKRGQERVTSDYYVSANVKPTSVPEKTQAAKTEAPVSVGLTFEADHLIYTIASNGLVLTGYQYTGDTLTIPKQVTYKGNPYTVIAIGPNVFWGNKTLKTITLPSTIRVIEAGAFGYCSAEVVVE